MREREAEVAMRRLEKGRSIRSVKKRVTKASAPRENRTYERTKEKKKKACVATSPLRYHYDLFHSHVPVCQPSIFELPESGQW